MKVKGSAMKRIYADFNATTPMAPEVIEVCNKTATGYWGNPSSIHQSGQKSKGLIEESRYSIAKLLGCSAGEIFFTSGGTESNTLAILGAIQASPKENPHFITSAVEHSSVLNLLPLFQEKGISNTVLPVNQSGQINLEELESAITDETALVSIMHANNETGSIMPIDKIGAICRKYKVPFHTDAVQTIGKMDLSLAELPVEFLSFSAHKFYGPKGIGGLFIKNTAFWKPLIPGGHQERGKRPGTENLTGIAGMAKALELVHQNQKEKNQKIKEIRDSLENFITENIPHVSVNSEPKTRMENTLNVSFRYAAGESILMALDMAGIDASAGSACTSGSLEPSHVLSAMGVPIDFLPGTVRFSFGAYSTIEDAKKIMEVLPPIVQKIRENSPFWQALKEQ